MFEDNFITALSTDLLEDLKTTNCFYTSILKVYIKIKEQFPNHILIKKTDRYIYKKTQTSLYNRENLLDIYYIFCKSFSLSLYTEYNILTNRSPLLKEPLSKILYVCLYSCLAYKNFEKYQTFLNLSIEKNC